MAAIRDVTTHAHSKWNCLLILILALSSLSRESLQNHGQGSLDTSSHSWSLRLTNLCLDWVSLSKYHWLKVKTIIYISLGIFFWFLILGIVRYSVLKSFIPLMFFAFIYIYICVCVCVCIYIYICTVCSI